MDQIPLVESKRQAGKELLDALDAADFPVSAAIWHWSEDEQEWKYVIASPIYDREGPIEAYSRVQTVLQKLKEKIGISLDEISVVGRNHPLIQRLLGAVETAVGPSPKRGITDVNSASASTADAYVYRLPTQWIEVETPATAWEVVKAPRTPWGTPRRESKR